MYMYQLTEIRQCLDRIRIVADELRSTLYDIASDFPDDDDHFSSFREQVEKFYIALNTARCNWDGLIDDIGNMKLVREEE